MRTKMKKQNLNTREESKQILLCNSQRPAKDFLTGLSLRNNGKNRRKPNYFIEKSGKIHHLNKEDITQEYLSGYSSSGVVVVALENIGWLKRRKEDGKFIDWLGNIYNNKVHEKKWRGKIFWDNYTEIQLSSTIELLDKVCKQNKIPNHVLGHNVLVDGVENFKGIVCRSNYNEYWTDLNPSFNFEIL